MNKTLAQIVKETRIANNMSQEKFAKSLGYSSRTTINKIELGINDMTYSQILKMIKLYSLDPNLLLQENRQIQNDKDSFVLYGDILYSNQDRSLKTFKNHYLVVINGLVEGIYDSVLEKYKELEVLNYENKLIIPGLMDLHCHASQYQYRGTCFDVELLEWLEQHAFPEESKYKDLKYAKKAYSIFVKDLKNSFTTRASLFATLHKDATLELMKQLENAGLVTYVGLVNMNRESPDYLLLDAKENGLKDTIDWIKKSKRFKNTYPIITPRFTPSCTREYMNQLGEVRKQFNLPVQSHLDENLSEIEYVKALEPWSKNYAETYVESHLFGQNHKCIMAHSIFCNDDELEVMKDNKIFVAHCPDCNMNVKSGIAPIDKYFKLGINVGLGSDIGGGSTLNLFTQMKEAIQVSKMYFRYIDNSATPLTSQDAFFLATRSGGSFFGKVGAFEKGYEFDALVIDDSSIVSTLDMSLEERLERLLYLSNTSMLLDKYARGKQIKLGK